MDIGTHDSGHPTGSGFLLSTLLILMGGVFHFIQTLSADAVYIWSFRILTLVSLSLVIYINWNKAIDIFRTKRKPGEK